MFGVGASRVARWAREGRQMALRTPGGHRRYTLSAIRSVITDARERCEAEREFVKDAVRPSELMGVDLGVAVHSGAFRCGRVCQGQPCRVAGRSLTGSHGSVREPLGSYGSCHLGHQARDAAVTHFQCANIQGYLSAIPRMHARALRRWTPRSTTPHEFWHGTSRHHSIDVCQNRIRSNQADLAGGRLLSDNATRLQRRRERSLAAEVSSAFACGAFGVWACSTEGCGFAVLAAMAAVKMMRASRA
jgi:hypothetical protein